MRAACVLLALPLALGAAACSKPSESGGPSPTASASATTTASAVPPSAPSAVLSATQPAAGGAASAWSGTYKSAAATLTVVPAYKKQPWSDTKSTEGIGDGAVTLAIEPGGRVSGSVEGPLGPATVDGILAAGKVSASVRRKDPTDHGFTGILVGDVAADHIDGTMSVSLGQASVLRTATFTLKPAAGAPGK
jgi:hypothetical protein